MSTVLLNAEAAAECGRIYGQRGVLYEDAIADYRKRRAKGQSPQEILADLQAEERKGRNEMGIHEP